MYAEDSSGVTVTGNQFSDLGYNIDSDGSIDAVSALANNTFQRTVTAGGDTIYGQLQLAMDDATAGDTLDLGGTFASGVTIDKSLTLEGFDANNRPVLTGGILISGSLSDITLKNLSVSGTVSGSLADFVVKGSGVITNFTMDNVKIDGGNVAGRFGVGAQQIGGAISITNSQFNNINGWVVFDTRPGAGGTPGADGAVITSGVFSNNTIDNSPGEVNFRQASTTVGTPLVYPDITISGNVVTNVGSSTNGFGAVFKAFNAGTVNFQNNNVSGVGTSGANGAVLMTRGASVLNVTGNTFSNDNMVFEVEGGKSLPGTTTFSNNTFTNNAYSIYLPTNIVGSGTISFTGTNNFVSGPATVQDIVWTSPTALDLTSVQFNGKLGSAMTQAELFTTEDLITHAMDHAGYGPGAGEGRRIGGDAE